MESPKFNNKPNQHVRYNYNDGCGLKIDQDFWISRAVAVVAVVLARWKDGKHILVAKRSDRMMDEAGKWGVPCGYLDWGETTYDAMVREVYEETSMYLPTYEKQLLFNNNKRPFAISDDPTSKRQNVSLIYINVYDFCDTKLNFPLSIEDFTSRETSKVKWLLDRRFMENYKDFDWAFNHDQTIKDGINFYNKNFGKL